MMQLIGFLGILLDVKRSEPTFRPSVALCMRPEWVVKRFYLLHNGKRDKLLQDVIADIAQVSPHTEVVPVTLHCEDPYDLVPVFRSMLDFVKTLPAGVEYHVNLSTGTHMQKHCWLRLAEAGSVNFKFIQTYVANKHAFVAGAPSLRGACRVLDFNYAKHDAYQALLQEKTASIDAFLKAGIVTKNESYNQLIADMERISLKSQSAILIEGPTGSGKSALARRLYDLKHRAQKLTGPFISINCATLHPEQAQSALFGHVKGAFTGAASARQGLLKAADGGVLFLDEINSLPMEVQGLLLHAMEHKTFYPVGSDKPVSSDFVIFCGSNQSLKTLAAQGMFRTDLLSRLDLWHFVLPGLRERPEDIEPNLEHELAKWQQDNGQFVRFNHEARDAYLAFATHPQSAWSRNFRDLAGSVERMCVMSEHGIINQTNVTRETARLKSAWSELEPAASVTALSEQGEAAVMRLTQSLSVLDAQVLRFTILHCLNHHTLTSAAKALYAGVDGRGSENTNPASRLKNYLDRMQLDFKEIQSWRRSH